MAGDLLHPCRVALRCREAFGDPIRLGVAISSYDDAVEIIEECVGDSVAEHDKPALADRLWRWSLSREVKGCTTGPSACSQC